CSRTPRPWSKSTSARASSSSTASKSCSAPSRPALSVCSSTACSTARRSLPTEPGSRRWKPILATVRLPSHASQRMVLSKIGDLINYYTLICSQLTQRFAYSYSKKEPNRSGDQVMNTQGRAQSKSSASRVLLTSACAYAALMAGAAHAQEDQSGSATQVSDIIVTGSRVARPDYVANSPIVSVSTEAIEDTGQVSVERALTQLPQF